jgi:hypothetical protein
LTKVQDDTLPFLGHPAHRRIQLFSAVAPERPEYIPREALRVHAHKDLVRLRHVPTHKSEMVLIVTVVLVEGKRKLTIHRGDARSGQLLN